MYKITLNKSRLLETMLSLILIFSATDTVIAQQVSVSGTIRTLSGGGLADAVVTIRNADNSVALTQLSGNDGSYEFLVPPGDTYTITPYSDVDPLLGVSTFDLALMIMFMDGNFQFLSPFQFIAADVNGSNSVDGADSTLTRNLITGAITEFPNVGSWRFVRTDYVFPDPQNPFPFPETITLDNVSQNVSNADFTAVKAGDINNSATYDSTFAAKIYGQVRIDGDENCIADITESPIAGWVIKAEGSGGVFYTTTQSTGHYLINALPGTYDVTILKPNGLWLGCVETVTGIQVDIQNSAEINFPMQVVANCPYLDVDLSIPFLRRCFNNDYTVFYCNKGTAAAQNASIEVELDPYLTLLSSSAPWSSVNGNTYTFDLGNLAAGECGSIYLTTQLSCEAILGQTHCSEARIFPDSLCTEGNSAWSGANLKVDGECNNGEVTFTITNIGADMTEPIEYIVIEDIMIQMTGGNIMLDSGGIQTVTVPANGSTWRLEMPQVADNPLGNIVSATVEGCGENSGGTFSLGFVTLFPQSDESPYIDTDCQENIGAFDPNDKQGMPRGVYAEHFIPLGTEIEYLIRFQNTGTDTAFTVRILDTLPQWLDVASIRQGGSSHPCTFNILGPGVVQFLFQNILLPDSNVNEAASHGYAKFAIRPKADASNMTLIENEAAIYFDFNEPVITNLTKHTLGEKYLDVSTVVFRPGIELVVYPNPVASTATFSFKSSVPLNGILRVFDLQGRQIKTRAFYSNTFDLDASGLLPGIYLFRVDSEGQAVGSGKLIVKRK
ncbi:MAG: T9SS type A sorting domain-containing protein [Lewinellaceae bacterium]|nr:T9SS type A sorting domain-containing protein [Lewinellaceae bacterium]